VPQLLLQHCFVPLACLGEDAFEFAIILKYLAKILVNEQHYSRWIGTLLL